MSSPLHVFFSFASEDDAFRIQLEKSLSLLRREKLIESWNFRQLIGGDDWRGKIDRELERADIILLLVSRDFIASEYCWDVEVKRALARHKAGEARAIPVILRSTDWKTSPIAKLQALPTDAKPVTPMVLCRSNVYLGMAGWGLVRLGASR